ncbi:MAG: aldo/keto reductase [Lachnospiraceae bacterium]|nr:aldo/keto reductase [Lachnospiraceae bacterium]
MYYKNYGNTEMKVSAIGFGCMRYDDEDIKKGQLEKCAEVALYAHEKGINYFDTAPLYSYDNKSEIITGMALSQVKRDSYYISTKGNFGTCEGTQTKDGFRRRLETSLKQLKVDYIDFYHLWCIMNLDGFQRLYDAMYEVCEEAKAEGLIRNIVFSSHMPGEQLEKVIETDKFKGMLIGYNALNYRFRQNGISTAYEKGMGVVAMNPLGGGLIPDNADKFAYLTEGTNFNVAQAALRFVASHREITVALAGCKTKAHVDDACLSVENLVEKPAVEICKEYENTGESINDMCTGCNYCDKCPAGIQIPKYMDAYNMVLLGGSFMNRLAWHWDVTADGAGDCTRCGLCEGLCTQHLNIMDRLTHISNKVDPKAV